jgi:hypothetical protein
MPPGRRDIPTEEDLERMRQANASYRIGRDKPSTSFGNDGLFGVFKKVLETLGEKALSPVIDEAKRYGSMQDQLEYQNSRLAPSRYYESLPSMKQAVLSDMAMGYMPSADAMEGIREQRRMESPGVFATESAAQEYRQGDNSFQTTGQFEKPLFIVGDFTQDKVDQRTPIQSSGSLDSFLVRTPSGQDVTNYLSTVIKNLKNDEGILVRSDGYNAVGLEQPPYMVVTKRDGIVYQRGITPDEYNSFQESFRTGYPAGDEQIKIDEISSRSMYPRTQFDKILDTLPQSEKSKLRQLSYMDLAFGPEGYVVNRPGLQGSAINIADTSYRMPSYYEGYGDERDPQTEYVFIHELAHAFAEKPQGKSLSKTREFIQVQDNDAKESAKFIGKVNLVDYGPYNTLLGEKGITEYGIEGGPKEDLAERFTLYTLDKMGTPIAYNEGTGEVVRFADIYPWSAAFFDKYLVGKNARRN